jgi:tripartite-type tricarboxylate transporter receptor subunit TctC
MKRRLILAGLTVTALGGIGRSAQAQGFPAKTVKIVVLYAAGGQPDIVARIMAQQLQALLGQSFVVENIPGSAGIAGIESMRHQEPDGYTLLVADAAQWAVNRVTRRRIPYNFQRDLEPIAMACTSSLFLAVHESFPASNLADFVAAVKSKPGFYTYGSSGIGSLHHLTMEAFKAGLGLDILHVPYKGTGFSVPALVGGQVSMAVAGYTSVAPYAKAGRVKIIAANTRERSALLPQIPTMGEAGLKDFHFPGEHALFALKGTPKPVVDKLAAAVAKILAMPDTPAKLNQVGLEVPQSSSTAYLVETIQRDIPRYEQAVRVAAIEPE